MIAHGGDSPMELCLICLYFCHLGVCSKMPPRRAGRGHGGRGGRGARVSPPGEESSGVHRGENRGNVPNPGAPVLPVNFAREIATAIVEAT